MIGALVTANILRPAMERRNGFPAGGAPTAGRTVTHLAAPPGVAFDEFGSIAISPDGRWVAAVAGMSLWVRDLSSTAWKRLPGTETASFPFWSPSGDAVAFSSEERRALMVVSRTGATPPVKVCDSAMNGMGSWHENGNILFTSGPTNRVEMTRVGWGHSEIVTRANPGETVHVWPQFLPDGQRFIFVAVRPGVEKGTTALCLAKIGDPMSHRTLLEDVSNVQVVGTDRIAFVRHGVLWQQRVDFDAGTVPGKPELITTEPIRYSRVDGLGEFAFATNGVMIHLEKTFRRSRLLRIDRSGQPVGGPLVAEPTYLRAARVSPDGKRVGLAIFDGTTQDEDVWVIDVASAQRRRLTHDAAPSQLGYPNLAWMPDSMELVYGTSVRGPSELRFIPLSGAPSHATIEAPGSFSLSPNQILPDRTAMLVRFDPKTRSDIVAMRFDGSEAVSVKVASPWWDDCPRVTPDQRWMLYISNDEDPRESAAWLARFSAPGERIKLRVPNPIQVEWGPGSSEVFVLAGGAVWSVPIRDLASGNPVPGAPQRLFSWPWPTPALSSFQTVEAVFGVFPDGQHFLMSVPAEELSPARITVIQGWGAPSGN